MKVNATAAVHGKPVNELDHDQGNSTLNFYQSLNSDALPTLTHLQLFAAAIYEALAKGPTNDSLSFTVSPSRRQQFAWIANGEMG
jgi:hypothetical protein